MFYLLLPALCDNQQYNVNSVQKELLTTAENDQVCFKKNQKYKKTISYKLLGTSVESYA